MRQQTSEFGDCIDLCLDCSAATRAAAIKLAIRPLATDDAPLLLDCSQACRRTGQLLILGSARGAFLARCADLCDRCGDICGESGEDAAADACWKAAAGLRALAAPALLAAE